MFATYTRNLKTWQELRNLSEPTPSVTACVRACVRATDRMCVCEGVSAHINAWLGQSGDSRPAAELVHQKYRNIPVSFFLL